mmetsp:Transcript_60287/g.169006  ORF Transcript_60287/g.169006 Transcript_60287/m.169006 type:complete len:235 (-) Transcript_60287:131-835(-)
MKLFECHADHCLASSSWPPQRQVLLEQLERLQDLFLLICVKPGQDVLGKLAQHLLRHHDGLARVAHDLMQEHREVEHEAQVRRMTRAQLQGLGQAAAVGLLGLLRRPATRCWVGVLGQVAVVIALHLQVVDLRLQVLPHVRQQVALEGSHRFRADLAKLRLHLRHVVHGQPRLLRIALLLLREVDRPGDSHSAAPRCHRALERRREHLPLVLAQRAPHLDALRHEIRHVLIPPR